MLKTMSDRYEVDGYVVVNGNTAKLLLLTDIFDKYEKSNEAMRNQIVNYVSVKYWTEMGMFNAKRNIN